MREGSDYSDAEEDDDLFIEENKEKNKIKPESCEKTFKFKKDNTKSSDNISKKRNQSEHKYEIANLALKNPTNKINGVI